jgi:hypothetical protein
MSTTFKTVFALLVAGILVGCSKPEDKFVGHYEGKIDIDQATKDKITQANPQGAAMLQEFESMSIALNLNADKTYSARLSGMSKRNANNRSGTWTLSGNTITITNGGANKTVETLTASEDGKTLTQESNNDIPGAKIVFTKTGAQ